MKIVNKETFLKLPQGTLFSYYEPMIITGFMLKGDTISNDFTYSSLLDSVGVESGEEYADTLLRAEKEQESFSFDIDLYCYGREGMYDNDQLYLVWERKDVKKLAELLENVLKKNYQNP